MRYTEGTHNAEFISWEVDPIFTRQKIEVTAPDDESIAPGTVEVDNAGAFKGIVVNRVMRGQTKKETCVVRGPAVLIGSLLVWPEAAGDPIAVPPVSDAAATAELKTALLATLATRQILLRD